MQKILLTITFFFFPVFIFPDLEPVIKLVIIGLIYEIKVVIVLLVTSFLAGVYSIITSIRFLFSGLKAKYIFRPLLSIIICCGTFIVARNKMRKFAKRPFGQLRGAFLSFYHFQTLRQEFIELRNTIILTKRLAYQIHSKLKTQDRLHVNNL